MTSLCFRTHNGEKFHTEISDAQVTQMHIHTHARPHRCRHKEQPVFHQSGPWNQWRCCLWCKRRLNSNVKRWQLWRQATANYDSEFLSFLAYHAMYCTDTETDREKAGRIKQAILEHMNICFHPTFPARNTMLVSGSNRHIRGLKTGNKTIFLINKQKYLSKVKIAMEKWRTTPVTEYMLFSTILCKVQLSQSHLLWKTIHFYTPL